MLTPFLNVETPTTFKDHPNTLSALFYTQINKCNLNCYQCHNRRHFKGEGKLLKEEELKEKLSMLKLLGVELIIVSGGEPTLEPKLKEGLKVIKEEGFPIRLDTNGTNPQKVKELIKEDLIDGVALDVKIPLKSEYTPSELKRFKRILFSGEDLGNSKVYEYSKRVKLTLKLIEEYPLPYNILRTVKYPLLKEEEIELIKREVKSLPCPYQVNQFYPVEEA
ncbi:radical SAM protein [Thermovibrio sp.]